MFLCRKFLGFYFCCVLIKCAFYDLTKLRVVLQEFWLKSGIKPKEILQYQYLAVCFIACTNADRRDAAFLSDLFCQRLRH